MQRSDMSHVKLRRTVLTCQECLRRKQKCDRLRPCSNCVARKVEKRCIYDKLPGKQHSMSEQSSLRSNPEGAFEDLSHTSLIGRPTSTDGLDISSFGYSRTNEHSALGSLAKLQSQFEDLDIFRTPVQPTADLTLKSRYDNLIAQLPEKTFTTILVRLFFENVNNWQYSVIDPYIFQVQLDEWWDCIPNMLVIDHPKNLPNNDEYFPALLFQVVALSLQFIPATADIDLEPIKQGNTVDSLSTKYSNLGHSLMALLGRHSPTLSSIQHDLLRSAWLKNADLVPESWHTLSQAVRQAQEIGLHEEDETKLQDASSLAEKLTQIWRVEYRKRVWLNLLIWDIQMAMMLGRPRTIDINACKFVPPINCSIPDNPSETIPQPLKEGDKPSSFTERLIQYKLTLLVVEMYASGANRPFPRDPSVIDTLHQQALSLLNSVPASLRYQNPDTTWDSQCSFLLHQREFLLGGVMFFLLTLHRPHISTRTKSREAALEATFMILESQQRLFKHLRPQYYKLNIVTFFNFDASVQLAVILLSEPKKEPLIVQRALQCIGTAISRLEVLAVHSALAKASIPLIRALYQRLHNSTSLEHDKVDHPQLATSIPENARVSNINMMSNNSLDLPYMDGGLWAFDPSSTRLSLNFGQDWADSEGGAWNIPTDINGNEFSTGDPQVDLWTPMNQSTNQWSLG